MRFGSKIGNFFRLTILMRKLKHTLQSSLSCFFSAMVELRFFAGR
jgi:hypothetical protein